MTPQQLSHSTEISTLLDGQLKGVQSRDEARGLAIQSIAATDLQGSVAVRWQELRRRSVKFESPYFDIEFTKAVARIRDDVEIAIAVDESETIQAFFPFQRVAPSRAVPVGGRLSDVHGLIGSGKLGDELIRRIMKEMKLRSYAFHAGLKTNQDLASHDFELRDTYFMDLSQGWENYIQWAKSNSVTIKRQGQKTRALERKFGPLRFEFDCQSYDVLEKLIELKSKKYQRSNTFDILGVEWAADLLREIHQIQNSEFQGSLSALWAGEHLVATHFGMLTDNVLHYWFPVFVSEFARYSPGTELMLRVARQSAELGLSNVDLGFGDDPYKSLFCNGRGLVSCGQFGFSNVCFTAARQKYFLRKKLKRIPFKPVAKKMLRSFFPGYGKWNFS